MRMRQLGQGQSVMFFAPQEIDLQIRKAAGKLESATKVEAIDILRWSMLETCNEITHRVPQWHNKVMITNVETRHGRHVFLLIDHAQFSILGCSLKPVPFRNYMVSQMVPPLA